MNIAATKTNGPILVWISFKRHKNPVHIRRTIADPYMKFLVRVDSKRAALGRPFGAFSVLFCFFLINGFTSSPAIGLEGSRRDPPFAHRAPLPYLPCTEYYRVHYTWKKKRGERNTFKNDGPIYHS